MSKISTIMDNFRARMAAVLADHKELSYPRSLFNNNELFLTKGQGCYLGPGINTQRNLSCRLSKQINMTVVITRANRGHDRDIETRILAEKNLLEDQLLIIKDIEKDSSLDSVAARVVYQSDNGIDEVFVNEKDFLFIQTNFLIEYFEDLT
jgi:hypothetical protein